ncbi:MAG: phosphate-starvation-inducible PsiE family protein [Methanoregula sp.]|jgi:uncharacterized membrane protein (DUF373 family)|uniref:phosphate-starvation-inducible PsiE family protein n=1 Tax=Methanoregula sp. TaxID=2052170 RepID=UPI003C13ED6C
MPENPPAAKTPVGQPGLEYVIRFFSLVPMVLYIIVAALLTIIAVFSVCDAAQQIATMIGTHDFANGLVQVIYSLLLTITIIVLFETVTVYFRTKHVEVRALLIAGLTGIVRHILVYNVATTDALQMFATVALLAVLIAGIVLVKSEVEAPPV